VKPRSLTYEQECELYKLLELRRSLSLKKLMNRFHISYAVIGRVAKYGPSPPRPCDESSKKSTNGAVEELHP